MPAVADAFTVMNLAGLDVAQRTMGLVSTAPPLIALALLLFPDGRSESPTLMRYLPLASGDSFHSDPTVEWTSDGTAWSSRSLDDGGYGVTPGAPSSVSGTYFAAILHHWLDKK